MNVFLWKAVIKITENVMISHLNVLVMLDGLVLYVIVPDVQQVFELLLRCNNESRRVYFTFRWLLMTYAYYDSLFTLNRM